MKSLKSWSLKKIFIVSVFSSATFAVSFAFGEAITATFGPGTSGIITIIMTTILVVICGKIVDVLGTFTLLVLIFSILAIPTTIFGPPGPQKIFIGLGTGIIYDILWYILDKNPFEKLKRISPAISASGATGFSIFLMLELLKWLNYPKKEILEKWFVPFLIIYSALGFFGGYLGNWIYENHLKDINIIKQLKSQ